MIPLAQAKSLLNKYGHKYTDEEVKTIRQFISLLIDIDVKMFRRRQEEEIQQIQRGKIIQLKPTNNEESDSIHPCEYRRAS